MCYHSFYPTEILNNWRPYMKGPHIEHFFLQLLFMSEFIRVSLNVYVGMCVCVSNTHELLSWAKVLCQLYELCVKVANTKTEPTKLNLIAPHFLLLVTPSRWPFPSRGTFGFFKSFISFVSLACSLSTLHHPFSKLMFDCGSERDSRDLRTSKK